MTPKPKELIVILHQIMKIIGFYSMLLALAMVCSIGSVPPEGESLITRMLVMGFEARRFESISSANISLCEQRTNLS